MFAKKHWTTAMGVVALAVTLVLSPSAIEAQAASAWLAVRQCDVEPGEGLAMSEAFTEFVEYAVENTPDLPGNVYGSFRQRVWGDAHFTTLYEVASIAEYDEMVRARFEVMANDSRWQELWRGWNSHLVPQSCQTSFHQRWPTG
jgi:hypothetical protein